MEDISEILTRKTEKLADDIETLINTYEKETGISISDVNVTWQEDCLKHVRLLCDYYNFDRSMVRRDDE